MALTITKTTDPVTAGPMAVMGDRRVCWGTITFDSSYPTGGEAVAAADFGFDQQLDHVMIDPPTGGNRIVTYDRANKKLMLFTAVGTEAANASDQSSIVVPFLAIGK